MKNWRIPWRAAVWLPLRDKPGASLLAILGVALGVALALAIALINVQAVDNVAAGLRRLSGTADLVLDRPGGTLSQEWVRRLAMAPEVQRVAPQLRVTAVAANGQYLEVWGIEPLATAAMGQPLLPASLASKPFAIFDPLHLVLDQSALQRLHLRVGDSLSLEVRGVQRHFRVIGSIPDPTPGQALAVMDLGAVQWLWGREGDITRLDIRLQAGIDRQKFVRQWQDALPPGSFLRSPRKEGRIQAQASFAYRANLLVLSLVALFTGAFLVHTTLSFTAIRQRHSLAILRVLGLREREVLVAGQLQGLLLGIPGAMLGVPAGILIARLALQQMGGDLGAGYFSSAQASLAAHPFLWASFGLAGVAAAAFGAFWPAWSSRHLPIVRILGNGAEEDSREISYWAALPLGVLALAGVLAPAWQGAPYGSYLAIALLLFAMLILLPGLLRIIGLLPEFPGALGHLLRAQLLRQSGRASRSLAAIVVAFSLVIAMAVMVGSFRDSVAHWLQEILHADLYLEAGGRDGDTLPSNLPSELCHPPLVTYCSPLRRRTIQLLPNRPPVMLLAQGINSQDPGRTLHLLERAAPDSQGLPPVWISEILARLGHWRPGQIIRLPLGPSGVEVRIAGIYQDYAYQQGAITLPLHDYQQWTGDKEINGLALWLGANTTTGDLLERLHRLYPASIHWQIATPGQIRKRSLEIFDQSFAATYALEAVAILIGLLGVGNGFGAQTLLRQQEFALLRCLGLRRRDIFRLLLGEGLLLSSIGVVLGTILGLVISLILIKRVNPLSFHWQMELQIPWGDVLPLAAGLILLCTLTMLLAARRVMGKDTELLHDQ
ncbi:MAG: ABC transporter permease [Acidithiobacillus sp.]|nr:ABC transporter permease [Acidithiobacillus sp.]